MSLIEICLNGPFNDCYLLLDTMHEVYLETDISLECSHVVAARSKEAVVVSIDGDDNDSRVLHGVGHNAMLHRAYKLLERYDDRCCDIAEDGQSAPLIKCEADLVRSIVDGLKRASSVYVAF